MPTFSVQNHFSYVMITIELKFNTHNSDLKNDSMMRYRYSKSNIIYSKLLFSSFFLIKFVNLLNFNFLFF